MSGITRRLFLVSSAAFPLGCSLHRAGIESAPASVRQPTVGQSWRYAKLDGLSRKLIDEQIDRVAAVGTDVRVDSSSEITGARPKKLWGGKWLAHVAASDVAAGPLPAEVQSPWGRVVVDPHWPDVQVYETPVPLWPAELRAGWSARFATKYRTPAREVGMWWNQTVTAHGWEAVTVPAGRFTALRFTNMIDFADADGARTNCVRKETLWLAPEVGRWVVRESSGSYYLTDSADDTPFEESSYRWELISYL
jgi:hypothetical protein